MITKKSLPGASALQNRAEGQSSDPISALDVPARPLPCRKRGIDSRLNPILSECLEREGLSTMKTKSWIALANGLLQDLELPAEDFPTDSQLRSFLNNSKNKAKKMKSVDTSGF